MRERDAGPAGDVRIDVSITDASLDGFDRFADLGSHSDGAVSIFQGRVRETNEGRRVVALLYEAYAEMAEGELRRICEEAAGRFDVSEIRAAHRTGVLELGEVSVAIGVAAPHRAACYDASRFIIEAIKVRLPVWKRETYEDGEAEWLRASEVLGGVNGGEG